ncbi:hypothetical protein WJX84_007276 [Apatococcus fuscideae]|uniref:Uncharacterized protein n=1 Tax=Apatococcus fuscideae TaxID=2026836 RepID=A0AAW1SWT3_9CHLO
MLAANKASHSAASSRASLPPKQQAEAPELPKPIELRHQDEQAEAELASAVAAALHSARVRQNSTSSSGRASPPVSDATRISATGKGPIGITSAAAKASPRASFDVSSQRVQQFNFTLRDTARTTLKWPDLCQQNLKQWQYTVTQLRCNEFAH